MGAAVSVAIVKQDGTARQLDRRAQTDEVVAEQDVQDAPKLTKLLIRMLRDTASLRRRWWPRRIDFEDVALDATGSKLFQLRHGFGGRVRWWIVEWNGAAAPNTRRHADTTADTLVLLSTVAGTATIRVEEAG